MKKIVWYFLIQSDQFERIKLVTLIAGKQPFTGTKRAAPGNLRLSNELYVNDNGGNVRKKEAVVA